MNKQRGGLMTKISLAQAIVAAALLFGCAQSASADEAQFGLIEFLYNGAPVQVVALGPYVSAKHCDTDVHVRAKTAPSSPDIEVRYSCVPVSAFKHIDMLGGPAKPAASDSASPIQQL